MSCKMRTGKRKGPVHIPNTGGGKETPPVTATGTRRVNWIATYDFHE